MCLVTSFLSEEQEGAWRKKAKGKAAILICTWWNVFLYFCVFLVLYHVSDESKGLFSLKKEEGTFTNRLLKVLQNKVDITILSIETKQKRVILISQVITYGTRPKLFTPNCVHSFIPFLLLCLYFCLVFFFPLPFKHLSAARTFPLEQLLLVYKQVTPIAAIPPLWIFFLMILRKTKLNYWFSKALIKL